MDCPTQLGIINHFALGRALLSLQDGQSIIDLSQPKKGRPFWTTFCLAPLSFTIYFSRFTSNHYQRFWPGTALTAITAMWWIAATMLPVVAVLMIYRTPKEEANLIAEFGDHYRQYMAQTGRYLPKLG